MRSQDSTISITSIFDKRGPIVAIDSVAATKGALSGPIFHLVYPLSLEASSEPLRARLEAQIGTRFEATCAIRLSDMVQCPFVTGAQALFLHSDIADLDWFLAECHRRRYSPAIYLLSNGLSAGTVTHYLDLGVRGCYDLSSLEALSQALETTIHQDSAA